MGNGKAVTVAVNRKAGASPPGPPVFSGRLLREVRCAVHMSILVSTVIGGKPT